MKTKLRLVIVRAVVRSYLILALPYRWLVVCVLPKLQIEVRNFAAVADHQKQARRMQLETELQRFMQRFHAVESEVKQFSAMSNDQRGVFIAAYGALRTECQGWMEHAKTPTVVKLPFVLKMAAMALPYIGDRCRRRQRKSLELQRILQRIDSPTILCDLVLWMLLPASFGVDALGDLNEEMQLKADCMGEEAARRWYRRQVVLTVRSLLWQKVSDMTTLVTLVDLLNRLRRK